MMAGGLPPALVGRVGLLVALIASDPIQLKATVAGSVRPVAQVKPLAPQQDRPPVLMVRCLDFTVEPGRTYRYRAQVVFNNPHSNQGNPRDRNRLIFGPWSEVTDIVTIPVP
jgi:hypothetical protein